MRAAKRAPAARAVGVKRRPKRPSAATQVAREKRFVARGRAARTRRRALETHVLRARAFRARKHPKLPRGALARIHPPRRRRFAVRTLRKLRPPRLLPTKLGPTVQRRRKRR